MLYELLPQLGRDGLRYMPHQCELVTSADCAVVTWTGTQDVKAALAFVAELSNFPEVQTGRHRLYDLRDADINLSAAERRLIVDLARQDDELHGERKVVFLVDRDLTYGLMRMFILFAGELKADMHVTRDPDEAKARVGLPGQYVLPADRQQARVRG